MEFWKTITGVIVILIGIAVFWQGFSTVSQCNSILGKVATAVTSIFGGTGAQACYNAQIAEIGGILLVLIGLAVIFFPMKKKGRK